MIVIKGNITLAIVMVIAGCTGESPIPAKDPTPPSLHLAFAACGGGQKRIEAGNDDSHALRSAEISIEQLYAVFRLLTRVQHLDQQGRTRDLPSLEEMRTSSNDSRVRDGIMLAIQDDDASLRLRSFDMDALARWVCKEVGVDYGDVIEPREVRVRQILARGYLASDLEFYFVRDLLADTQLVGMEWYKPLDRLMFEYEGRLSAEN